MKILEIFILSVCIASLATTLNAQTEQAPVSRDNTKLYSFYFNNAPLNAVLDTLQDVTGKSITVDLGVTASLTLETPEKITADEVATLIIQELNAHGIRLEDLDENTIRVRGIPKPRTEPYPDEREDEALKRRLHYAERRRQRMTARQKPVETPMPVYSGEELGKHLQEYQMEVIREGLPPLNVQLAPENIAILKSESVAVPTSVIEEHSPEQSSENNTDNIE